MFVSTHSRHDHASGQVQYDASGFDQHPDGTNFIIAMEASSRPIHDDSGSAHACKDSVWPRRV